MSNTNPFASFLLGYMINQANTASVVQIAPPTYTTMYYQGYFVQDNWPKRDITAFWILWLP